MTSYHDLRIHAEAFWDVQEFRKSIHNKVRSETTDTDAVTAGLKAIEESEKMFGKAMVASYRAVAGPNVRAWQKASLGIGEHLLARLLGVIGDPYVASPMHWEAGPEGGDKRVLVPDQPYIRNVAKLWSYCGYGDPARKRVKGMSADQAMALGNPRAKVILHLIAEACVKTTSSPYRLVYDQARERYADRVHAVKCPQCAGSSEPGQPWRPGHQHAAALRMIAKEILVDLWEAAREDHRQASAITASKEEAPDGQGQDQAMRDSTPIGVTPGADPSDSRQAIPSATPTTPPPDGHDQKQAESRAALGRPA